MKRSALASYDSYPNNIFAQNALYYKMSNHYRRLYNAKPCVDTSTPKSYKLQKQKEKSSSNKDYIRYNASLIVRGKSILKNNGSSGEQMGCRQESKKNDILNDVDYTPFRPRVLKTNVESKLRNSRCYHPPRKKLSYTVVAGNRRTDLPVISPKEIESGNEVEEYNHEYEDDVDWLQLPSQDRQDARSSSKPSSSDSAYTEEGEGMWSGGESRDDSPQQLHLKDWPASRCDNYSVTDHRYVKFLMTITDEVLRKGIYTNKALKKVFQEHIHKNKHKLDEKRMREAVEKLQEELGIPKDDDLNDLAFGLGCTKDDVSDSDYRLGCDNLTNVDSRLCSSTDIPYTTELIESVDQLNINSSVKEEPNEIGDWLYTKVNPSSRHNSNDLSDNIRLPLKLPIRDNDNDSSIGCEILSGSSDNEILSCNENNLGER